MSLEHTNPFWISSGCSEQQDWHGTIYGLGYTFQLYCACCMETKDGLWQPVAFTGRTVAAAIGPVLMQGQQLPGRLR